MATRRSEIKIEVQGLSDLQALNKELGLFNRRVSETGKRLQDLSGQARTLTPPIQQATQAYQQHNIVLQQTQRQAQSTGQAIGGMVRNIIAYNTAWSAVGGVEKIIRSNIAAMVEYDKQAARIMRVTGNRDDRGLYLAAMREEAARTGVAIDELGESFYQVSPFVKDFNAQMAAVRSTLSLVVGLEVDARTAARGVIQVFNEFGQQLDKSVSEAENFRRIGELYAIAFKQTNTEIEEVIQSLKYLGPAAVGARVPLEQVFAVIGALDKAGIRASTAGTSGAQFISSIITKYDEKLGGTEFKGQVYKYQLFRTPDGGIDIIKTLDDITNRVKYLREQGYPGMAEDFLKAVSGNERAFRVVSVIEALDKAIQDMSASVGKYEQALKGATREQEKLAQTMQDTFLGQFKRAWGGIIADISGGLDDIAKKLGVMQGLKAIADHFQARQAYRSQQETFASYMQKAPDLEKARQAQLFGLSLMTRMAQADIRHRTIGGWGQGAMWRGEIEEWAGQPAGWENFLRYLPNRGAYTPMDVRGAMDKITREISVGSKRTTPRGGFPGEIGVAPVAPPGKGLPGFPGMKSPWDSPNDLVTPSPDTLKKQQREREAAARKAEAERKRRLREIEQAKEEAARMADLRFESALRVYGPLDDRTRAFAVEADRLYKFLPDAKKGFPGFTARDRLRQSIERDYENVLGFPIPKDKWNEAISRYREKKERKEAWDAMLTRGTEAGNVLGEYQARVRGFELGQRPYAPFADAQGLERQRLAFRETAILETLKQLERMKQRMPEVAESIAQLNEELSDTRSQAQNLSDQLRSDRVRAWLQDMDNRADDQRRVLDRALPLVAGEWESATFARQMQRLQEILSFEEAQSIGGIMRGPDWARNQRLRVDEARYRLTEFQNQYQVGRYNQIYNNVQGNVAGGAVDFLRGRAGAGEVLRSIGDSIVDTALYEMVKKWADPLVIAISNEIAALQGLTVAVNANTAALGGRVPAPAGGTGGGTGGAGAGSSGKGKGGVSPAVMQSISQAFAAYSVFEQGREQGVTIPGLLGGALTGLALGGPVGAAIGFGVSLLGGLFRKKRPDPLATDKNRTPSFYNSPSDFDYWAYRYRATGQIPADAKKWAGQVPVPTVNVYVDGVKTSVRAEISSQTSTGKAALTNVYYDAHRPI